MEKIIKQLKELLPIPALVTAVGFGIVSFLTIQLGVKFYVPGTSAQSDLREIFNALGSSLTGPLGGLIIGIISCLSSEPKELFWFTMGNHIVAAVFIGFAYKKFVYEYLRMPALIIGWLIIFFIYYIPTYLPSFAFVYFFFQDTYKFLVGDNLTFWNAFSKLYKGWTAEIVFSFIFTTLLIIIVPSKLRKPLWGKLILREEKSFINKTNLLLKKTLSKNFLAVRLSLWFILLFTLPLLFINFSLRNYFLDYYLEQESKYQLEIVSNMSTMMNSMPYANYQNMIDRLNKSVRRNVFIIDKNGKLFFSSENKNDTNQLVRLITEKKEDIFLINNGVIKYQAQGIVIAFGTISSSNLILISASPKNILNNQLNNLIWFTYRILGISLIVISLIAGLIIWIVVGRPLNKLSSNAVMIGQGNFDIDVDYDELTDEVQTLASSMDKMKTNIQTAQILLTENELKFRTLFETANDSILIIKDNLIVDCNPKTSNIFKLSKERIVNHSLLYFSPEFQENDVESKSELTNHFNYAMHNRPQFFEWKFFNGESELFDAEISINTIQLKEESYLQAVIRNVTERKQVEYELKKAKEKAEESDRLKSEFLAQMSHEIRTPIHQLISQLEMLQELLNKYITPEYQKYFQNAEIAGKRIIRTIDSILVVSEINIGSIVCSPTFISITKILNTILEEFDLQIGNKQLEICKEFSDAELYVYCDEANLIRICSELLDNAIRFTDKGKIKIIIEKNNNEFVLLKCQDSGIGISREYLPHIYDIFSQEEQGRNRGYEGNGLGLTIVKGLCDLNNIKISIDTEKGKGSTFILQIPTSKEEIKNIT